jgi:hypothetical protein
LRICTARNTERRGQEKRESNKPPALQWQTLG